MIAKVLIYISFYHEIKPFFVVEREEIVKTVKEIY
jgi:hypothetical protein